MIDWLGEFQVSKVSWIGLVVQISQAWIVGTAIDGLAVDLSFVASDSSRNLASIDCNGLCNRVLSL